MQHKGIIIILLLFLFSDASAQGNENSVYSRFGLGDPIDNNFMHLRSMGGIGASYIDAFHINIVNPASYSHLKAVAFDMGVKAKISRLSDGTNSQSIQSGSMEYFSLALPLNNPVNEILEREERDYSLGMAFTLMPHTQVGYNISQFDESEEFGTIEKNFIGTGGTYKFIWGNSLRYKDFSVGLNMGYLFGKISYSRNIFFEQEEFAFNDVFTTEFSARGFLWNTGFMYTKVLNKSTVEDDRGVSQKRLTLGFHIGSNTSFSTKSDFTEFGIQQISASQIIRDTIFAENNIKGNGTLPGELGLGFTYQNGEKLTFGMNYTHTNWSDYKNDANPEALTDAYKVSAGGFYRPNFLSQKSYWDRVFYRYGIYYSSDPRAVVQEDVSSYGLNIGLGLPFIYQRRVSHANIGMDFGIKGNGTPIKETYFKLTLGFTFNDSEWFLKRRYD